MARMNDRLLNEASSQGARPSLMPRPPAKLGGISLRALLLGLVLLCVAGAGCAEAEAPELAAPGPPPAFAYSLYVVGNKAQPGADLVLVQRPQHLEHVYAQRRADERARVLFGWLESQFRQTGTRFADMTALACALDLPIRCTPDWEFMDSVLGHSDGPGAMRLRQVLADSFSAQARKRGVETAVVLSIAQAVLARGMVKGAVGKASVAAEGRAAAVGAERWVTVTGRLRAPRELSAIQARLVEAEAVETGARQTPVLKELSKLRPSPERPPVGVDAGEPLWRDYANYWDRRFVELSAPEARTAGPLPPLTWEGYRSFRSRFARAMKFQSDVSAMLQEQVETPAGQRQLLREMKQPRIDENVGLAPEGSDARTFADQLAVDEATLASKNPRVEAFSTKQRDFTRVSDKELKRQVEADAREALRKYGGSVEVRRPGHPLFERRVSVTRVHVVYDEGLVPQDLELRNQMKLSAGDLGVTLHFHHAL